MNKSSKHDAIFFVFMPARKYLSLTLIESSYVQQTRFLAFPSSLGLFGENLHCHWLRRNVTVIMSPKPRSAIDSWRPTGKARRKSFETHWVPVVLFMRRWKSIQYQSEKVFESHVQRLSASPQHKCSFLYCRNSSFGITIDPRPKVINRASCAMTTPPVWVRLRSRSSTKAVPPCRRCSAASLESYTFLRKQKPCQSWRLHFTLLYSMTNIVPEWQTYEAEKLEESALRKILAFQRTDVF